MRLNISEWALRHRTLVVYFMFALAVAGAYAYTKLGQAEDPDFTFKVMVVRVFWPGATAREVELQVTDRLEKKLQEVPWFDFSRSYSKPGEALVFLSLKDFTPPEDVANIWYQARKKISDIRHTLPAGIHGPFFNDEFGDTFGTIYAFTTDGYTFAELRDHVEQVRRDLLRVPDVGKVEFLGEQEERIFVEFSHRKLATLGVDPTQIVQMLQQHNSMVPAGRFETPDDQIYLRTSAGFHSVESVREIGIQAGGRLFRLGDIAEVRRGYIDPPVTKFRYRGQDAMGLAVSMTKGGDIIALGKALDALTLKARGYLPAGIEMHQVMDQPKVVERSIQEFMRTLIEALIIVLAVSFLSLGMRTGVIVALSIPGSSDFRVGHMPMSESSFASLSHRERDRGEGKEAQDPCFFPHPDPSPGGRGAVVHRRTHTKVGRTPFRSPWQSRFSACWSRVSICSAFPWARSSSRWACWWTMPSSLSR